MSTTTIDINERTQKNFSVSQLEAFVNSEDFEDLVLGYQMIEGATGRSVDYKDFKKNLGL